MGRSFQAIILVVVLQAAAIGSAAAAAQGRPTGLTGYEPGTIVVKTAERRLYYVLENGQSVSYPVAVGKAGKTWTGVAHIQGKFLKPAWSPPEDIRRDKPSLPDVIPCGAPENPMGVAAMTLNPGEYASTAPMLQVRLATSRLMAASACTTTTSWICISAWMSARRSWC